MIVRSLSGATVVIRTHRVGDLDILRRRATICENAVEVGSEIIVGTTKGHKLRSVPLTRFLAALPCRQCEGRERCFPATMAGT